MVKVTTPVIAPVARRLIFYRCDVANGGKLMHSVLLHGPAVDLVLYGLQPQCDVVGRFGVPVWVVKDVRGHFS